MPQLDKADSTYFEVIAELSEWSGNHERELTTWVFGNGLDEHAEELPVEKRPHAESMKWAHDENGIEGTIMGWAHDEYGFVYHGVEPSSWPLNFELNPCVWRFAEKPSSEQMKALKSAIDSYEVERKPWHTVEPAKVKCLKLSLVEVKTTYELID